MQQRDMTYRQTPIPISIVDGEQLSPYFSEEQGISVYSIGAHSMLHC